MPDKKPRFTSIQGGRAAEVQPSIRSSQDRLVDEEKPFARDHLLKSLGREPTEEEIHAFAKKRSTSGSSSTFKSQFSKEPPQKG